MAPATARAAGPILRRPDTSIGPNQRAGGSGRTLTGSAAAAAAARRKAALVEELLAYAPPSPTTPGGGGGGGDLGGGGDSSETALASVGYDRGGNSEPAASFTTVRTLISCNDRESGGLLR